MTIAKLTNDYVYIVLVATHKNLLLLINNEGSNFLFPMESLIVIKELTRKNIERAIKA